MCVCECQCVSVRVRVCVPGRCLVLHCVWQCGVCRCECASTCGILCDWRLSLLVLSGADVSGSFYAGDVYVYGAFESGVSSVQVYCRPGVAA